MIILLGVLNNTQLNSARIHWIVFVMYVFMIVLLVCAHVSAVQKLKLLVASLIANALYSKVQSTEKFLWALCMSRGHIK